MGEFLSGGNVGVRGRYEGEWDWGAQYEIPKESINNYVILKKEWNSEKWEAEGRLAEGAGSATSTSRGHEGSREAG